jgi:DNA polymerase III subunit delta
MDYAGFLKAADAGTPPAVALLAGPEPFLLDDGVSRVTRGLFPDGGDLSLSREVLEARDAGVDGIVHAALTLPWMGSHRLVVAKGVDELGARAGDALAAYCRAPNPSTVLVLLAAQALAATHWLAKAIPRELAIAISAPAGGQLVAWLRARARTDGLELTDEAATLLVELVGDDLTHLRGELEKAALAGGADNRRIGPAEVRAVVGETRARHVFDLTRALVDRDRGAALTLLGSLLGGGEEPFALLGMLSREARAIWRAADGLRAGLPEAEIARGLGRPPAAAAAMIGRARGLDPAHAAALLTRCWEAERRLKLGGIARPELSLLIADLCGG